ncbi:ATP-binding protein [Kribbella sp. NPDC059898]|uniref:ATP-binding protein n=1 Tax=Kribbella sp. NPDC059898 TaxID=3346995 RepID=UPI003666CAB3
MNDQFRISRVQLLNWGGYCGLQTMSVRHAGTAILGPSGRGKSTMLDALASVIMPNPQEFNQAARDDKAGKRERTVYTYARGLTDRRRGEDKRSGTTTYLRPPGSNGFASGTAITWTNDDGRKVTVFRLVWVSPDTSNADDINSSTVYGLVHDDFPLEQLNGLRPVRAGAAPLTKATLTPLIDVSRGDIVDSQARVHAKMRTAMSMGKSDESQRLAMQLLRRAQASKGIFNINALFKEFVLTEPLALSRWTTALAAYQEAIKLYKEFEDARKRQKTLAPLPEIAERYKAAGADYVLKQELLKYDVPRLKVWHAEKIDTWAEKAVEDNALARAEVEEELQKATLDDKAAKQQFQDVLNQFTAAGGDPSQALALELKHASEQQSKLSAYRAELTTRLGEFKLPLPTSRGDVTLTKASIATMLDELAEVEGADAAQSKTAAARADKLAGKVKDLEVELKRLQTARTNIPPEADNVRARIAAATKVPVERLPYAGELLQIKPQHRGWSKAVQVVLRGLVKDLVVDERDLPNVRKYVNDHDMRSAVTLAKATATGPVAEPIDGTIPALLDIADSPCRNWIQAELNRFPYCYVERDTDLNEPRPRGTIGAVTRSGMRTGTHDRFVKDDRPARYTWIGWDTHHLRSELNDELTALREENRVAQQNATDLLAEYVDGLQRSERLKKLRDELNWTEFDLEPLQRRIGDLRTQITGVDTPELKDRRQRLDEAQELKNETGQALVELGKRKAQLENLWEWIGDRKDEATRLLDGQEPLTADERAGLAKLPFNLPQFTLDGNVEAAMKAAVLASYRKAVEDLRAEILQHEKDRETLEGSVLATIRAYRNLDEKSAKEIDENIESLEALLAIHQQILTDDLPRTRSRWLAKVDQDMNTQLQGLLVQIDEDRKTIQRGIDPVNAVLAGVTFREASALTIDIDTKPSKDLHEFRATLTAYTSDTLMQDVEQDAEQIERSFLRLRKALDQLHDLSKTGESWRRRVFDAREHLEFKAIETRPDGVQIVHDGVAGMSGGEGQELIAFILGAALRYRLGEGGEAPPTYASIVLDEGFVKSDSDYTGRALSALSALGFQLIVAAPREKATAFENHVETVAYINSDPENPNSVRIFTMTIEEALDLTAEDVA